MAEREPDILNMQQVGWRNISSGAFHPVKMDFHPGEWWVPVFAREADLRRAEAAIAARNRRYPR